MRYYIHIVPPHQLALRVADIADKYHGEKKSDPHITLISPREIEHDKLETELIAKLEKNAASIRPFIVETRDVDYFGEKEHIFVRVKRSVNLVACYLMLKYSVEKILKERSDDHDFQNPHITLVSLPSVPQEEREVVWQALKNSYFIGSFICSEIELLAKGQGDERWRVIKKIKLSR